MIENTFLVTSSVQPPYCVVFLLENPSRDHSFRWEDMMLAIDGDRQGSMFAHLGRDCDAVSVVKEADVSYLKLPVSVVKEPNVSSEVASQSVCRQTLNKINPGLILSAFVSGSHKSMGPQSIRRGSPSTESFSMDTVFLSVAADFLFLFTAFFF